MVKGLLVKLGLSDTGNAVTAKARLFAVIDGRPAKAGLI